jgi:hypothetical protein
MLVVEGVEAATVSIDLTREGDRGRAQRQWKADRKRTDRGGLAHERDRSRCCGADQRLTDSRASVGPLR